MSKLVYPEIGDCLAAADPLLEQGWITEQALLTADEIAELLRKDEVLTHSKRSFHDVLDLLYVPKGP
nr:hypothetical protein [Stutzerimonas frequens]